MNGERKSGRRVFSLSRKLKYIWLVNKIVWTDFILRYDINPFIQTKY